MKTLKNNKRHWIATQPAVARNDGHSSVIPEICSRESRRSGFTLVELVIVIAIVIILSVVSVPIYRGYTRNAKMSEGYALLGAIFSSQKAYYSQYGNFLFCNQSSAKSAIPTCNEEVLGIDARGNKYFTAFVVARGAVGWMFRAHAVKPKELSTQENDSLALAYTITSGAVYYDNYQYTEDDI